MANPFEDSDGVYLAVVNEEGQYSLWPQTIKVPAGWDVAYGPGERQACLDHIVENWTDMRPKSLVRAMEGD